MIGLGKSVLKRSVRKKTVVFNRFAAPYTEQGEETFGITGSENSGLRTGETLCAKTIYNCDASQGFLMPGVGSAATVSNIGNNVTSSLGESIVKIIRVRFREDIKEIGKEMFLLVRDDGYLFRYVEETANLSVEALMGTDTNAVLLRSSKGEERYLIIGESNARLVLGDGSFAWATLNNVTCAVCECKNRLFGVQKGGRLVYSDPMEPWTLEDNIDDSGYICLPSPLGDPIALTTVGECVYVFFRQAIMRLHVHGSARDFVLEEIVYSGRQIIKGSICSTGDGIIFLARDGLWKLQGTELQPFARYLNINLYQKVDVCQAAVCSGKYFLRYQYSTKSYQSIAVDLSGKSWYVSHNLPGLSSGFGAVFYIRDTTVFELGTDALPDEEPPLFESVQLDFGVRGKKKLRRLEFDGLGDSELRVYCDGVKVSRYLQFLNGKAAVDLDMRGEKFSFALKLIGRSRISGMRAEVEF